MYEFIKIAGISWLVPVGSACDYPVLTGLCMERWALTHPLSSEETEQLRAEQTQPNFLDMVPWTSADLIKTVFDLLVSVTVFVGRFDMRVMQAAMSGKHEGAKPEEFLYDHFSENGDFWFDFMADTGDGGNYSYSVVRLLAQPSLEVRNNGSLNKLPRANLLLIGGDLAYPNPSAPNYEKRLFHPFEDALQPPSWYREDHLAVNKPELPIGISELKQYDGPQCFVIPGNHDWFDGLQTFMRYICHKSWLGGWLMPQKKSYFALHLPKGWWVFGLDLALHTDIDSYQFKFFAELIQEKVKEYDSVIVMTHAPNWIIDWYWDDATGKNVSHLIHDHLKGSNLIEAHGNTYEMKAAYPSAQDSSRIALGNILKFRKKNWQFDFIGGFIYFTLTFSMFPLFLEAICINWLHLHFDEAFSSLRIANYKSFTRFHNKEDGSLEVFTLAVDKVPKEWKLDTEWNNELRQQHQLSHHRQYPSKWRANSFHQDPINTLRIVDHFVIQRDEATENRLFIVRINPAVELNSDSF
ncbi:hypothetical protein QVD17_10425 [Tagetes erecta]|uniref:Calcineurin-like phosphoesterase domain-containing protein n=1 Tax=Tagetes erecta TaxID=13708 RepID=A0AAD8L113_TARER|nr:hypothetical protein QVD17_10425 [Tagetes erecta]